MSVHAGILDDEVIALLQEDGDRLELLQNVRLGVVGIENGEQGPAHARQE